MGRDSTNERRYLVKSLSILILALVATGALLTGAPVVQAAPDIRPLLEDYVEDFQKDPFAADPVVFGIRVADADAAEWHVVVEGKAEGEETSSVRLVEGFPTEPVAFFVTDSQTLQKLHQGELASLTAMGKAKSIDFAPLDLDVMEGFEPTPERIDHLVRLSFHFWTRGFPEIVRFGDKSQTRDLHGANGVLFYYQKGFRSGWFLIEKGQHVNEDPTEQVNPFPTLLVVTHGTLKCKLGGSEHVLHGGEMIYIGAGVSHEFWNELDEPVQGVIIMFGEGA